MPGSVNKLPNGLSEQIPDVINSYIDREFPDYMGEDRDTLYHPLQAFLYLTFYTGEGFKSVEEINKAINEFVLPKELVIAFNAAVKSSRDSWHQFVKANQRTILRETGICINENSTPIMSSPFRNAFVRLVTGHHISKQDLDAIILYLQTYGQYDDVNGAIAGINFNMYGYVHSDHEKPFYQSKKHLRMLLSLSGKNPNNFKLPNSGQPNIGQEQLFGTSPRGYVYRK